MTSIRLLGIPGLHPRGMRRSRTTIEILHGCSCTFPSTFYHSPPLENTSMLDYIWVLDRANHTISHQIETQVPEAQPHQLPPHENVPQGRRPQEEGRCVGLNCQTIYTLHYLRVIPIPYFERLHTGIRFTYYQPSSNSRSLSCLA